MNPECTNYGEIQENCTVCVEESTDKENVVAIRKNGHVWISVCEEFYEILKEKEVLEEVKEVMRRAKTKKDSEVAVDQDFCGLCRTKFHKNNISLKCTI